MKYTLCCVLLLVCVSTAAYAQLPTVEELIQRVEQNFRPIDSLKVTVVSDTYLAPDGSDEPPTFYDGRDSVEVVYHYPDTLHITEILDIFYYEPEPGDTTTVADTVITLQQERREGNRMWLETITKGTQQIYDRTVLLNGVESGTTNWERDYITAFSARFYFRFRDFINGFTSVSVTANPEPDIYIITVSFDQEPLHRMKEIYIDFAQGIPFKINYYDTGTLNGSIEDPSLALTRITLDFQQIQGIWLPYRNESERFITGGRRMKKYSTFSNIEIFE